MNEPGVPLARARSRGLAASVALGCLPLTCLGSCLGVLPVVATLETQWAPGYRELEFHRLQVGDTREQVRARLGEPLSQWSTDTGESWAYTRSPHDTHYWCRVVLFDASGRVVRTHHELYVD